MKNGLLFLLPFSVCSITVALSPWAEVPSDVVAMRDRAVALLIAKLGDVKKRRLAMLGSIIGKGAVTVALGSVSHFWAAVPLFALYGISGPFFGSFCSALFGRLAPEELRFFHVTYAILALTR